MAVGACTQAGLGGIEASISKFLPQIPGVVGGTVQVSH
jgi:hypothetical protein